jgi:hypothetical protein
MKTVWKPIRQLVVTAERDVLVRDAGLLVGVEVV